MCRWWHNGCDGVGDPAQPFLPERHLGRKRRLLGQASLDLTPLLGAEHAQHVFGGNEIATGGRICGVVGCSCLETGPEFQQSTSNPALHGAERHAHTRGQFLVRWCRPGMQPGWRSRGAPPTPPDSARGVGAAAPVRRARPPQAPDRSRRRRTSIGSMRRLTALARKPVDRSVAGNRYHPGDRAGPPVGSKLAALRHNRHKKPPAARPRPRLGPIKIRRQTPKSFAEVSW